MEITIHVYMRSFENVKPGSSEMRRLLDLISGSDLAAKDLITGTSYVADFYIGNVFHDSGFCTTSDPISKLLERVTLFLEGPFVKGKKVTDIQVISQQPDGFILEGDHMPTFPGETAVPLSPHLVSRILEHARKVLGQA